MISEAPQEQLNEVLKNYQCTKDKDIETFLQTKAVTYEKRGWCSVYLLIDKERFVRDGHFFIDGYFTLSNKIVQLTDAVSGSKRRKLFNGMKKESDMAHFILIGQLGKYIGQGKAGEIVGDASATQLLDQAFGIIYEVKKRITCSCVLIECRDEPKLCRLYEDYGFRELQRSGDMHQYFKIL